MRTLSALLIVSSLTSVAAAEPLELGARVGGYGFRHEGHEAWDECRMNGFGVFGQRAINGPLFVEAGIDMYATVPEQVEGVLPIDRTSGLFSAAIGARSDFTSRLRGYLQLGAGIEITRVSVPYGDSRIRDSKTMPEGFFGIGMDLRLGKATYFGSSIRALVMGNFDYDAARLDMNNGWIAAPSSSEVFDASPDVAAQAQFYVRHEL